MNYIWEFFINIIESGLFFIFINSKLVKRESHHSYILQIFVLLFLTGARLILNIQNVSVIAILLIFIILHYIYTRLFFSSPKVTDLFCIIIYNISVIVANASVTIIATNLMNINTALILFGGLLRIPFSLLYIITLAAITLILLCFSSNTFKLNMPEKISFIFLSILILVIEIFIVSSITKSVNENMHLLYIIFFLVMLLFIFLAVYIYYLGFEREKYVQLSNIQVMSELERNQYEQIISSISELRYLQHDIYNHLETLNTLITNKEYDKAMSYIQDLTANTNDNYYILTSGNSIIDSIITNKLIQCKAYQITVHHSVFLPEHLPLLNTELCSLLGNLFDNAIDASRKVENPNDRIINFHMKPFQNMLSITISNYTIGEYKTGKKQLLLSSKNVPDVTNHGLGLSQISTITKSHGGIIDILPSQHLFTVSILLPLFEQEEEKCI